MSSPSVTVLMTSYNAGRFLDPAIRSIVNQTFRDWEFLIVDDCSTDGSVELAAAWTERDPRIRLVRNPANKGQTACLNQGLREARGKWIARQDADDLSHPLRLTRQFEAVTACPDLVLVGTSGRMIDGNDRLAGLLDVPSTTSLIRRMATFINPFLHTSVFFSTRVVRDDLGGYNERFRIAQDYDLWCRLVPEFASANLTARLVSYRHLASSLSKSQSPRAFDEAREIGRRHTGAVFPGRLTEEEVAALDSFREGLSSDHLKAFHSAIGRLGEGLEPGEKAPWQSFESALNLRAAGSLHGVPAIMSLVRALRASPMFAASWLVERFVRR